MTICLALSTTSVVRCSAQCSSPAIQALIDQGNPAYGGCQAALLPSASDKYADLMAHISQARHYINLEYFIFRRDSIGNAFLHLLHQKVTEGVKVRLLIDAYGNHKSPLRMRNEHLDSIRALGIDVALYDPIHFPWLRNVLCRDHRKIVIVDGLWAWTGGINIADYYLRGTARTGPWRDMQVRFSGPVVSEFNRIFCDLWRRTTGQVLPKENIDFTEGENENEDQTLRYEDEDKPFTFNPSPFTFNPSPFTLHPSPSTAFPCDTVVIINREPRKQSAAMRKAYVATFDSARRDIFIVNPYPTLVPKVRRAMRRALKRGVHMSIMVSSRSDNNIVPDLVSLEMYQMARRGAEIYCYDGGFHHSKVLAVDDTLALLGTTNLDARSLRFDYEITAALQSPEMVTQLRTIFNADTLQSHRLTRDNYRRIVPLRRRILARIMRPIRGVL